MISSKWLDFITICRSVFRCGVLQMPVWTWIQFKVKVVHSYHHFYSPRILGVKWSALWSTWTCPSLRKSSAESWSSHPLRTWRRTRWATIPVSQSLFSISPSLPSWEKVNQSAPGLIQKWICKVKMCRIEHVPILKHQVSNLGGMIYRGRNTLAVFTWTQIFH